MGIMSVEVPSVEELLTMTEPACYGDDVSSEGTRGGALHLSSVLPAVSNVIGVVVVVAVLVVAAGALFVFKRKRS